MSCVLLLDDQPETNTADASTMQASLDDLAEAAATATETSDSSSRMQWSHSMALLLLEAVRMHQEMFRKAKMAKTVWMKMLASWQNMDTICHGI